MEARALRVVPRCYGRGVFHTPGPQVNNGSPKPPRLAEASCGRARPSAASIALSRSSPPPHPQTPHYVAFSSLARVRVDLSEFVWHWSHRTRDRPSSFRASTRPPASPARVFDPRQPATNLAAPPAHRTSFAPVPRIPATASSERKHSRCVNPSPVVLTCRARSALPASRQNGFPGIYIPSVTGHPLALDGALTASHAQTPFWFEVRLSRS